MVRRYLLILRTRGLYLCGRGICYGYYHLGRSGRWRGRCLRPSKLLTTQKRRMSQPCVLTKIDEPVPTQNVSSVNWRNMGCVNALGGDWVCRNLQRCSTKISMNSWKRSFLWLKSEELGRSNCSSHRYRYRSAFDKGKGAVATSLFNKVPLMFNQPIGNTLDVSVPWPSTLTSWRLQDHLLRFLSLVWTKRQWRVTTLRFMKMKISACSGWRTCQTCSDETTSTNRVSLENFDTLKAGEVKR